MVSDCCFKSGYEIPPDCRGNAGAAAMVVERRFMIDSRSSFQSNENEVKNSFRPVSLLADRNEISVEVISSSPVFKGFSRT